jgi:hypothetical protein
MVYTRWTLACLCPAISRASTSTERRSAGCSASFVPASSSPGMTTCAGARSRRLDAVRAAFVPLDVDPRIADAYGEVRDGPGPRHARRLARAVGQAVHVP